jgi:Fe-S-cluster containining protein
MSLRSLPGARWSCHSCAACCHHFTLGPVEPEIIAGLQARGVERDWPAAAGGWLEAVQGPQGVEHRLKKVNGACVFLRPDRLCAIHGLYGAEAKPGFCRQFPYTFTEDPEGIVATVRADCAGWAETWESGEPVEVGGAAHLHLQPRMQRFSPASVLLWGEHSLSLNRWMEVEGALLAELAPQLLQPEELARATRRHLASAAGLPEPAADPRRARQAALALQHTLRLVLQHVLSEQQAPDAAAEAYTLRLLEQVELAFQRSPGPWPELAPEGLGWLSLVWRSALFGKQVHASGSAAAGFGLLLMNLLTARLALAAEGAGPLPATEVQRVLSAQSRFTVNRSVQPILTRARPALVDLFLYC